MKPTPPQEGWQQGADNSPCVKLHEEVMDLNGGHEISKQAEEWGRLSGEQDGCLHDKGRKLMYM